MDPNQPVFISDRPSYEMKSTVEYDISHGIDKLAAMANGGHLVDRTHFLNLKEAVELMFALQEAGIVKLVTQKEFPHDRDNHSPVHG